MRTGENIYKRKDGRWEARYCKGRDEYGKIIYGFCYGKTYSAVKAKAEAARKENVQITAQSKKAIPYFKEVCDEWLRFNQFRFKKSRYTWLCVRIIK